MSADALWVVTALLVMATSLGISVLAMLQLI